MNPPLRLPDTIQTIPAAIDFWAKETPNAPALRALDGRVWSFRHLCDALARVALRLDALGVISTDRLVLATPPGADTCLALLGVASAAVAVPLNPALAAPELRRDLARLAPRLLIVAGEKADISAAIGDELGIATIGLDALLRGDDGPGAQCGLDLGENPEAIAVIIHTSGTTGLPKRVPRTHRSFLAGARAARDSSALTPEDVLLLTSWAHTNSGVVNLCAAIANGGCCVAATGFHPADFPNLLDKHQPTWMVSTATELNLIMAAADAAGREMIAGPDARLRLVRAGAQAMTPGTAERAEKRLRAWIFDGFGMSEASYITASGPTPADRRPGACGRPWRSEIRVLDDEGRDLPSGKTGEIVIRGETLFSGYLDDPEANAAVFLDGGWFRTGDIGSVDVDGYLTLSGRKGETINRGGEKIAPLEVDHALLTHPAVADAAVFPIADGRFGEDIVAAIVLRPGATVSPRELRGWLLARLLPAKVPRRMWIVESLPRTLTGKVQRGVLSERYLTRSADGERTTNSG